MSKYRSVQVSFWQDAFVLDLTPEEKYFYIYLMTNSKANQIGIYELPKRIIETETGYSRETVDKLLKRFIEYKKVEYDDSSKELFLINWVRYNWNNSPKVVSRVIQELQIIKNKSFVHQYVSLALESNTNKSFIEYGYSIGTVPILDTQEKEERKEKGKREGKEKGEEKGEEEKKNDATQSSVSSPLIDNNFIEIKNFFDQNFYISTFSDHKKISEMLDDYIDHLLIIEAMKISLKRNKPNFGYIDGIIKNWRKEYGITTFEQLNAKRTREATQHGSNGSSYAKTSGTSIDDVYKQLERDKQAWGD